MRQFKEHGADLRRRISQFGMVSIPGLTSQTAVRRWSYSHVSPLGVFVQTLANCYPSDESKFIMGCSGTTKTQACHDPETAGIPVKPVLHHHVLRGCRPRKK